MVLVPFTDIRGRSVDINPDHVVFVSADDRVPANSVIVTSNNGNTVVPMSRTAVWVLLTGKAPK